MTLSKEKLLYFSHWTTPLSRPKRFSTWFFIAAASDEAVQVDGGEIHDHEWMRPDDALAARQAGKIELPPPTFVSLTKLAPFTSVSSALDHVRACEPEIFFPKLEKIDCGYCSIYQGDAGYETANVNEPGPRHRLLMLKSGWRYKHEA